MTACVRIVGSYTRLSPGAILLLIAFDVSLQVSWLMFLGEQRP
jgi:hypothetical protein